jgi:organic radical activating enzyme
MPVGQVADTMNAMGVKLVVVSGGEPLVQQRTLTGLVDLLDATRVEIETNGTMTPVQMPGHVWYNVSPKLANSGITHERRIIPEAITALNDTGHATFKFVARDDRCMDEVDGLVSDLGLDPCNVWVMPEGRNTTDLGNHMDAIADRAISTGYNLTGRLHVTVWGDKRGV